MNNHTPCDAQTEVDRLVMLLLEATELLKRLEWNEAPQNKRICPWCRCEKQEGHLSSCKIDAYLMKAGAK